MNFKNFAFIVLFILSGLLYRYSPVFENEEVITEPPVVSSAKLSISEDKVIIKSVESITFISAYGNKTVKARIDTGASQSSIDTVLAKKLGYTKYIGKVNVISANGIKSRLLVEVNYELAGKRIKSSFTLADRKHLSFPVLIGRADLEGFLIDPTDK